MIKLNEAMTRDDTSIQDIVRTIMADQVLTSKILRVVNSSFYSPASEIISLQQAVIFMGFELAAKKNLPSFNGLSKFPEVRRDIAIVLDNKIAGARVLGTAREAAGELLVNLKLFDVYRGQGIENGKKSIALGIVLQHRERTLTGDEVAGIIDRIVAALATQCGATLRY